MLFLFPWISSTILYLRFYFFKEWDFDKFKLNNANECFEKDNFNYLSNDILTEKYKSNYFEYLKKKFNSVSITYLDNDTVTYRIGNVNNEYAVLGKDYILIQTSKCIKKIGGVWSWISCYMLYGFWGCFIQIFQIIYWFKAMNGNKTSFYISWYSLVEKGSRKPGIIRTYKTFKNNIYTKTFSTFNGMVYWITREFPEFIKYR